MYISQPEWYPKVDQYKKILNANKKILTWHFAVQLI